MIDGKPVIVPKDESQTAGCPECRSTMKMSRPKIEIMNGKSCSSVTAIHDESILCAGCLTRWIPSIVSIPQIQFGLVKVKDDKRIMPAKFNPPIDLKKRH